MTVKYARCPHCRTVFSVDPAELEVSSGLMRCGNCLKPFDVREHLSDELPGDPRIMVVELSDSEEPGPPSNDHEEHHADLFQLAESDANADALPASLQDDARSSAGSSRGGLARIVLLFLLLTMLALQFALFHPAAVVDLSPRLAPLVERIIPIREWLLGMLGVEREAFRDVARIGLVSRDVRNDPEISGALLARAVMVNRSHLAQPFPRVEFLLYDINGATLAARLFRPEEYLDRVDPGPMLPGQPVQFSLHIIAPKMDAVSFEFRFH